MLAPLPTPPTLPSLHELPTTRVRATPGLRIVARIGALAVALLGPLLSAGLVCAAPTGPSAPSDAEPFTLRRHTRSGLITQVWPLEIGPCPDASRDLDRKSVV